MPSKDTFHSKNPKVNGHLPARPSGQGRQHGIGHRSPTREMSAQLQRLAKRLDVDPDDLAKKLPADTVRRTKYPVIEVLNPDGTRSFRHDSGIEEGRKALDPR